MIEIHQQQQQQQQWKAGCNRNWDMTWHGMTPIPKSHAHGHRHGKNGTSNGKFQCSTINMHTSWKKKRRNSVKITFFRSNFQLISIAFDIGYVVYIQTHIQKKRTDHCEMHTAKNTNRLLAYAWNLQTDLLAEKHFMCIIFVFFPLKRNHLVTPCAWLIIKLSNKTFGPVCVYNQSRTQIYIINFCI